MSTGVYRAPPQAPKQSMLGSILPAVGSIVGSVYGGPVGGQVGGAIGGIAGKKLNQPDAPPPKNLATDSDAMERRLQELTGSPQKQIADSIDSLKYIDDPNQRAELAKPLFQANYLSRNSEPR